MNLMPVFVGLVFVARSDHHGGLLGTLDETESDGFGIVKRGWSGQNNVSGIQNQAQTCDTAIATGGENLAGHDIGTLDLKAAIVQNEAIAGDRNAGLGCFCHC